MKKVKVFIIGSAGTTGLRLKTRLSERSDVELLEIEEKLRKDVNEIKRIVELADFAFLCLPDTSSREIIAACKNCNTRFLDTSTAFRTDPDWAYGFPELSDVHRKKIENAKFVAVPGCHAGGAISIINPLIEKGVISSDILLTVTSLTGYSGGGKRMIAEYEKEGKNVELESPKIYAGGQTHKHLPEIVHQCKLDNEPVFIPIVSDYYSGMLVSIGIHKAQLNNEYGVQDIRNLLRKHYEDNKLIEVSDDDPVSLYSNTLSFRDKMILHIGGNDDRIMIYSQFDNLGKGASGAAVQCFNIMCGTDETSGLNV